MQSLEMTDVTPAAPLATTITIMITTITALGITMTREFPHQRTVIPSVGEKRGRIVVNRTFFLVVNRVKQHILTHLLQLCIIGRASAASEATLSSSPLRFSVYVGLVRAINP